MIAIDTSAIIAILLGEPEAERFAYAIEKDDEPVISAVSLLEIILVVKHKQGPAALPVVKELVSAAGITTYPATAEQVLIAEQAALKFNALNFGDLFSYSLAKDKNVKLLFKGNDFHTTDIEQADY